MVAVRLEYVCVAVVLVIVSGVAKLLVDDSHLTTFPTLPASVMVPPLLPVQTVAPPLVVPPTVGRSSITVTQLTLGLHSAPEVIVQVNV